MIILIASAHWYLYFVLQMVITIFQGFTRHTAQEDEQEEDSITSTFLFISEEVPTAPLAVLAPQ